MPIASEKTNIAKEFERVLARKPGAAKNYRALAASHQREYLKWIGEAKKAETRQRRMEKAIEMLAGGKGTAKR